MPYQISDGVRTYYQLIGKGPLLVLLHGWANRWEAWSPLIPELSKHYALLIPDLPGFGKSDEPQGEGWTTQDYAHWLSGFLSEFTKNKLYTLIGHSFGGKIGAVFCVSPHTKDQKPKRLILIGPSGIPNAMTKKNVVLSGITKAVPGVVKKVLPHAFVRKFYEKVIGETDYAYATPFQQKTLRKVLPEDITTELKNITIPTLIIWGDHDTSAQVAHAEVFHKTIPKSTLLIVKQAGHFPHIEQTEAVLEYVQSWMKI
ncbi:MAG: hypothetical protein A2804_00145 [Candidatus Pacebacteria bacterium RIFCSPHIGHO2_01_FULL_46_10]|nr:MAG: hypothetical protein A2804_00145 [Candidatus Pacebacteria bacterium RIFCSPHIGHO2_01_FULL_46_10]